MASYDAVIQLVVKGEEKLTRMQERVEELYKTIGKLKRGEQFSALEAVTKYVRGLEQGVEATKKQIKQNEKLLIQRSKLNSAVDLYERRLKQTVNSGAAGLKKFEGQIKQIEAAFKFFKDRGNVTAIQALATELGRMVEYSNSVSRNERQRAANQSQVFKYVKQINAYEEQGLDVAEARLKLAQFTEVADSNRLNEAKKYAEAVDRQLYLLQKQSAAQKLLNEETARVQQGLARLNEEQRKLENSKLDEKARQIQQALDKQAAAAAEAAVQLDKLNKRQSEFLTRTDEAARAARRQTAEFIRQQRIAKEVAALNAAAPPAQLLLPPAAPGAPTMGGGARPAIRGNVEIAGRLPGARFAGRTQEEAAYALRLTQNLKSATSEAQGLANVFTTVEKSLESIVKLTGQKTKGGKTSITGGASNTGRLAENLMLGVGFPLLFGGGAGQVLGGLLGSFVGTGFGGQILGSAIFGQLEQLGIAANQAGQALQKPIDNFAVIEQRALLASSSQERYVKNLIDAGQYIEATAAVQKRYNEIIGAQGSAALVELAQSSDNLNRAWNELNLQIQAALAGPLADLLNWVAGLVQAGADANKEARTQKEIFAGLSPDQQKEFKRREAEILKGANIFNEAEKRRQVAQMARGFGGTQGPAAQLMGFRAAEVQDTASLERRREIQAQITQLRQAELAAAQSQLQQDITILTKQQEFATSLNQQSAIIDKIAAKKVESANVEYQQVQRTQQSEIINKQLALESAKAKATAAIEEMKQLDSADKLTETKKAELQAVVDKVFVAEKDLATTKAAAHVATQRAQAERDGANALTELERRQQNVAAFAAEAARQTEAFNRAANEATNALNNRLKVSDALTQAALTVNNLEIQSLQNKLTQATTDEERLRILDAIRDLEIANAALTLQATRTQIQAEVERQRIAMSMAEVKYKELQAVVQLAAAQKSLTQSHLEALRAQASALQIARDNYATSVKVADAQMQAADAVYNASVNAANLRVQMEGTAAAAGAVAGAMDRVAAASGGGGGFLTAANIRNPILRAEAESRLAEIDKRTPRTGGIMTTLRALSEKQEIVLDYMAIEARSRKQQEMQAAAQELEGMGLGRLVPAEYRASGRESLFSRYGSASSAAGTSSASPQVNITTGPVMQMDGTNYVTQRDLVSATGTAARQGAKMALEMLQNNPSSRRSTGVTR